MRHFCLVVLACVLGLVAGLPVDDIDANKLLVKEEDGVIYVPVRLPDNFKSVEGVEGKEPRGGIISYVYHIGLDVVQTLHAYYAYNANRLQNFLTHLIDGKEAAIDINSAVNSANVTDEKI